MTAGTQKATFSPYLSPAAPTMMHSGDFLTVKSARDQMHRCVQDFDAHACSGQSWTEQLERTYQQPAPRLRRIRDLHPSSIRGKFREQFSWPGAAPVTNTSPQGRLAARPWTSEVYRYVTTPHSIKTRFRACNSRVPAKERATPARRCVCRFSLAKQISQCVVRLCRIPQQSKHEKGAADGLRRHTYTLRRLTSLRCLDAPVPETKWLQWLWSHSTHEDIRINRIWM